MKNKIETQYVEFKSNWRDEFLKAVCAFANSDGGTLFVGVNDDGEPVGVKDLRKLLDDIPNKIRNKLGIISSVEIETRDGVSVIKITVAPQSVPISYDGKYYIRSGSNNFELRGTELSEFLLKKHDINWDEFIEDGATFEDIHIGAIEKFKEDAIDRIPAITKEKNGKVILEKLNLVKKNKLKRAAIMLFGKNPQNFHTSAYLRIGKFLTETDILTTDIVKGNLFEQLESTLDILRTKYLLSYIKFEGIHRREVLEYPYEALREVILNALIHRNYLGTSNIQVRVYDDRIVFMNEGKLPPEVPIEKLKTNHLSKPGNPLVADVFYKAGFIESWGRGTLKIIEKCLEQGLPEPDFNEDHGVFTVTLYKTELKENILGENVKDTVEEILALISENPSITMSELAKNTGLSVKGVEWNIKRLRDSGILRREGSPRSGHWEVVSKKSGKEKISQ